MRFISENEVKQALDYGKLIDALETIFQSSYKMPTRHHHFYKTVDQENTLILMPVWNNLYMGIKQVTVAPGNNTRNLPAIHALYTLLEADTGKPLALLEATELTARRTACTSALAAKYLAPKNASHLLIVGGGSVAHHLAPAHSVVRNYKEIAIWTRNHEKKLSFVQKLRQQGYPAIPVDNLPNAVSQADVISCATLSPTPIIRGEWIKPGTHLDLIGSHKPDTRETDDQTIRKSSIFVDSRTGALHETGELKIPIDNGILKASDVKANISELVNRWHKGRTKAEEITLFKSAGLAIEDLAAALLVYQHTDLQDN